MEIEEEVNFWVQDYVIDKIGFDYRGVVGYIKMPAYLGKYLLWPAWVHETGLTKFRMHFIDATGEEHEVEIDQNSVILARYTPSADQLAQAVEIKAELVRYTASQKERASEERRGQVAFGEHMYLSLIHI